MQVNILTGGQYAYACITDDAGTRHDIRLEPGRSAQESLREFAEEQERIAARAKESARRARRAIQVMGAPVPPAPKFVSAPTEYGAAYGFKCEGKGILVYGNTESEARDAWRAAYISEYCT